jgi:membrane-bound serine protease (ClpP class)
MRRWLRLAVFSLAALLGFAGLISNSLAAASRPVLVVPIDGVVDQGMAHLVARAVAQADDEHAAGIVFDINTPGGLVDAAFQIRDSILDAKVPTLAFVSKRAYSAGALITLANHTIVMAPGSSIGAAEPRPNEPKYVSALRAEFASTAQRNHRNATLVSAMVDKNVDAPAYKKAGAILSLTAEDAKRAGIADAISPTLAGALQDAGISGTLEHAQYTWGEWLARFATTPEISGILLSIGVLGLFIEMQTLHGIAGLIGVSALALFFGSHIYAGFANNIVIALAVLGVIGILFELHVLPGHGVAGTVGAAALLTAVVMAFGFSFMFIAAQAVSIAIVLSVIALWASSRMFPESAFMKRIVLTAQQGSDYVTSSDFGALVGRLGFATSYLRPAGVANVDGRRVDVLTEGDFVPAGAAIRVTRVEGARIFVKSIAEEKA